MYNFVNPYNYEKDFEIRENIHKDDHGFFRHMRAVNIFLNLKFPNSNNYFEWIRNLTKASMLYTGQRAEHYVKNGYINFYGNIDLPFGMVKDIVDINKQFVDAVENEPDTIKRIAYDNLITYNGTGDYLNINTIINDMYINRMSMSEYCSENALRGSGTKSEFEEYIKEDTIKRSFATIDGFYSIMEDSVDIANTKDDHYDVAKLVNAYITTLVSKMHDDFECGDDIRMNSVDIDTNDVDRGKFLFHDNIAKHNTVISVTLISNLS